MKKKYMAFVSVVIAALLVTTLTAYAAAGKKDGKWNLRGTKGIIVGGYGDNFDYGGADTRDIKGHAKIRVNADQDVGTVTAKVRGMINPDGTERYGEWKIVMKHFAGPMSWMQGGIAEDLTLHGATGRGPPVMPKVQTFLGGWGTADVYLDGELVRESLDAHFMYTDGARDEDYKVWCDEEKTTLWSPMCGMMGHDGYADPDDREFHIVVHSEVTDTNNFPQWDFFIHLNFEEVDVKRVPPEAAY